jgi:Holliday junction resolvase-like predicted endonuclease
MTCEKHVIISILRLTQTGPVSRELLRKDTRLDSTLLNKLLTKFADNGLFQLKQNWIEVSPSQRVNLAFRAIMLGGDLEKLCRFLKWTEFEGVAAEALQVSGFKVLRNFRFKRKGKRWEMDVIGFKEPLVVCIDCKHWRRRLTQAALIKAVEAQLERTKAFADTLPNYWTKTGLGKWKNALIVPLILSLVSGSVKFYNNVPIVSILQLRDFINTLPLEAHLLTHFSKKSLHGEEKLTDYCK